MISTSGFNAALASPYMVTIASKNAEHDANRKMKRLGVSAKFILYIRSLRGVLEPSENFRTHIKRDCGFC